MKNGIAMVALAAAILAPMSGSAQEAELTAEVGWVSEYYYRGIPQKTSSASAGVELGLNGLYAGTWAADVGDGAEVDLYGGYLQDFGEVTLGVGGTGYFYTGDFDDTYLEGNLFAGVGPIGVEFSLGRWEAFDQPTEDYTFLAVTGEHEGAYATVGTFGGDFSGSYGEVGYGFAVSDVDLTISWVWSDDELSGRGTSDNTLTLGLGTALDLF